MRQYFNVAVRARSSPVPGGARTNWAWPWRSWWVQAKLIIKGTRSASRLWPARRMAEAIAGVLPGPAIHVVADSACAWRRAEETSATRDLDHPAAQGRGAV
jgi:hypothetical protein